MTAVPPPAASLVPTVEDVRDARTRLAGEAVLTPVVRSPVLDQRVGGTVLVKAEVLQRTGSFKFRGAYNRISRIQEADRARGVVAYSSGNHAQGVAAAARIFDCPATIVMPADAPAIKIANTRAYGAEVVLYDRYHESREAIGERLMAERGATLVRPFDDRFVIAGQGSAGLELIAQADGFGLALDAILVPCSGGGLTAGVALAAAGDSPGTEVYSVEPAGFDDNARSLAAGHRVENAPGAVSFCDALLSPMPGEITFAVNSRLAAGGLVVTDAEVAAAMAFAFETLKLVVEPGGAVALAAVLSGRFRCAGRTVGVICSGGNVDRETYRRALAEAA